jgi:hypothetical protein
VSHALQSTFVTWLDQAMKQPMPLGLVAFNFNLAEAYKKFQVDVIGATRYDPDDSDWVCDEAFASEPRFFDLPNSIVGSRWQDAQQLISQFVRDYIRAASSSSPLRSAMAVTVGFVDGELERVWPER